MAYTPPPGNSANFQTGIYVFPRPYNGLNFRQPLGSYSSPVGDSVLAQFSVEPADWAPPLGDDVDFVAWGPLPKIRIGTRTTGRWVASSATARQIDSPYRAPARTDGSRRAPWNPAAGKDISARGAWHRIGTADSGRGSSWGAFGDLMVADRSSLWARADRKDFDIGSEWGAYGDMLNSGSVANWHGSRPADIVKRGGWTGHLIPYFRIDPYIPPIGTSANFLVAGGGVDSAIIGGAGYSAPAGGGVNFQFGNDAYRVPFMPANPAQYVLPFGSATKFICRSEYSLVLDGSGNPALEKSARNAGKLNPWGTGKRRDDTTVVVWLKFSRPMNPGWGVVTPGNPDDPDPGQTIIVPVRSIYMQTNTVTLVLAETGQPIPARGLRLSIDADSWVWGWSASVPASYLPLLSSAAGDLVELLASVNDTLFRLAVVHRGRDRKFGEAWLSVSGRGRAAWLGYPYAEVASRSNSVAMTAQQLMVDALTVNGVPIGWGIDWQITDWPVPAGAWNHTGTAMEACLAIAEAAGAYIQAHRTDQTLSVLPRYPAAPWNWASLTPDIDLPEDACETEGIEWLDKPAYNTVFISGKEGGILAHVTRDGSAGDKAAPMIVDGLITHTYAGGQRGLAVLSDTGSQKRIALNLPVLPETGIIVPGKLVRYTEGGTQHLGLTRAVEVNYGSPALTQMIQVESHVL